MPISPRSRRSHLAVAGVLSALLPAAALQGQSITVKEVRPDRVQLMAGDRAAARLAARQLAEVWILAGDPAEAEVWRREAEGGA